MFGIVQVLFGDIPWYIRARGDDALEVNRALGGVLLVFGFASTNIHIAGALLASAGLGIARSVLRMEVKLCEVQNVRIHSIMSPRIANVNVAVWYSNEE